MLVWNILLHKLIVTRVHQVFLAQRWKVCGCWDTKLLRTLDQIILLPILQIILLWPVPRVLDSFICCINVVSVVEEIQTPLLTI